MSSPPKVRSPTESAASVWITAVINYYQKTIINYRLPLLV